MMLLCKSSLLILFLSLAGVAASAAEVSSLNGAVVSQAKPSAKVPVELEWEEIPGASLYELEFQNMQGKIIGVVKSASHIFKFKFKVGSYRVRSRAADSRKVFGDWSALQEFQVQPRPVNVAEVKTRSRSVVNPKTLQADVAWSWPETLGALNFRLKVLNAKGEVVREELLSRRTFRTQLPAGEYTSVLTSVGADGIESEPVTLPGKIVIETVQLAAPALAFEELVDPLKPEEKLQRLPQTKGVPTLRWKGRPSAADTVGTLEYRYFFGEEWIPVDKFVSKKAQEVILDKAVKPGRYRVNTWSEASGFKKSEVTSYEFVVKPQSYDE